MYRSVSFYASGNNFIDTEIDFQPIINLIAAFGDEWLIIAHAIPAVELEFFNIVKITKHV